MNKWRVLDSNIAFATPYFRIRQDACELPNGRIVPDYYVYESVDVAMVFALTTQNTVLMVEQYKHGWGDVLLELPAGMCQSATPLEDAQRELLEETGFVSSDWRSLGSFIASPSRANSTIHTFFARDATQVAAQALDHNEDIRVHHVPLSNLMPMIEDGRIRVVDSVLAIYRGLGV
jgi:8-oxo-dGTP pyrophosphatase MutT (NUDIX family)